jgi:transposase
LGFLEQLARSYRRSGAILIQDNASYHKDADVWNWFRSNRHWLEVHQLPPYSPEFNPTERLWQHTRKTGTHNRYFATASELVGTLSRVFGEMQDHPESIRSYPICFLFADSYVPLIMRGCIASASTDVRFVMALVGPYTVVSTELSGR